MPCELVWRHIPSCSSKFDVKIENLEILDVGDYNISETITTTETWVAQFGSVTLPVGHSKNETRISLTVSEIFDRKQEPWTRYLFILIIKSFANFRSERLFVFARAHFSWNLKRDDANDNYISETITTIKTTYVPFGSVIIAIDESENRTRLSLTVSEIFDRKHIALNGERVISLFFFPIIKAVRSASLILLELIFREIWNVMMLTTIISQKR